MGNQESGGLRGLHAWVTDATERAARLMPGKDGSRPPVEAYDTSVDELTQLQALLVDDEALCTRVTVRLGVVLALRYLAAGGAPEDRERAQRLLRQARSPESGASATTEDRQWAALFLGMLVVPLRELGGGFGSTPTFADIYDWWTSGAFSQGEAAANEMLELFAEARDLPLPPEWLQHLSQFQTLLTSIDEIHQPGGAERLMRLVPDSAYLGTELQTLFHLASDMPDTPEGADRPAEDQGPDGPGQVAMNALLPTLMTTMQAFRTADPESLDRILERLSSSLDRIPEDDALTGVLHGAISGVLQGARGVGGNLQDHEAAREFTRSVAERFDQISASPGGEYFAVNGRAFLLLSRLNEAADAHDPNAVDEIISELHELEAATPREHEFRANTLLTLGYAYGLRGDLTNDKGDHLRGIEYLEHAVAAGDTAPPMFQDLLASADVGVRGMRAALTSDPAPLQGDITSPPNASLDELWSTALSLSTRYNLSQDPADLDRAIEELALFRERVREGERARFAPDALWHLAELHRIRWARRSLEDQAAATASAMDGLHALAADVVLQLGSEHGLLAARSGASRGVLAATWAASNAQVEEAVAALELGRALVLHTASVSASVPELLKARGHHEIAEAWRRSVSAGASRSGPPRELPSALRRRALEALGYRQQALFATPTVSELQAGVAEGEADALVYLLPGTGDVPGMAVVVGPDTGAGVIPLPLLSDKESGPLERYLDAAAVRSRLPGDTAAEESWEEALQDLCDWAFHAALGNVLTGVAQRLAANESRRHRPGPPRIVLVPCGRLGVVPWHAARLPKGAPKKYACQIMVISYAASGGQFLRTVRRSPRAPGAAPVLVADPRMDLTRAEQEVLALREAFYPQARLYGEFYESPVDPMATGTPDELLGLLREPLSLLHVASHGSAGIRPTVSALHLAFPPDADTLPTEEGGPGAERDLGMLTVTRLLDRASGDDPRPDGPLVVLSACETDLSTRDHDEALTLTTAFVASGARDVVGSRWTTQDGASALMMAVFHHYVAVEGRSPVDALRAAQMWMLDPDRENPGTLSGELLREMERPGLDRLPIWAAFIHQGHPGPGGGTP